MSIEWSSPDFIIHQVGDIQTLSQSQQWGIGNLSIPDAWKITQGKNVVIALLDTGVSNHPDVAGNIDYSKCASFIPNENIYIEGNCHGIHTAGIICATNDEYGVVGVAPQCKLIGIKVLDKNGMSSGNSVLQGLLYAESLNVDIINMSLGGTAPMDDVHDVIKRLVQKGVVICASAGNNGKEQILNPAAFDEVFAIGSYSATMDRGRSPFSSYGPQIDFLAPGEEILSTYCNHQYSIMSGTSMAAPFVSGVIALLISKLKADNKKLTVKEIKDILIKSCINTPKGGFDTDSGYGIIYPKTALSLLDNPTSAIPPLPWWKRLFQFFK